MNRFLLPTALATLVVLAACGANDDRDDGGADRELVVAFQSGPDTLHPLRFLTARARFVLTTFLLMPLLDVDGHGELVPRLAAKTPLPHGDLIEFEIRPQARFDDGSPVLASDVERTFATLRSSATAGGDLASAIAGVEAVAVTGERSFVIRCSQPASRVLENFGTRFLILDRDFDPASDTEPRGGIGAWRLDSSDAHEIVIRRERPHWTDEVADVASLDGFDRVRLRFIADQDVTRRALAAGTVDLADVPARAIDAIERAGVAVADYYLPSPTLLGFDCADGPTADRRVRRALAALLPRREMIENDFHRLARLRDGPFDTEVGHRAEDLGPAAAGELLAAAGFGDTNGDGVLDRDGTDLEIVLLAPQGDVDWIDKSTARLITAAGIVGVKLRVERLPVAALVAALQRGDGDAFLVVWSIRDLAPSFRDLLHSEEIRPGGRNFLRYRSANADRITDGLERVADLGERDALRRELQQLWLEDRPGAFLFDMASIAAWRPERVTPTFGTRGLVWSALR